MKVAKASLSQMPSHQPIVTRSPNHMWASSCAMTSATRSSSVRAACVLVDEERRVAEGDAAEVLHGAGGEVRDGDEVHLVAGVGDVEVVGEEAQRERADLEGELGRGPSSRACRPPGAARRRRRPSRSSRACRRRRPPGRSTSSWWARTGRAACSRPGPSRRRASSKWHRRRGPR